jgi:drug/metabolite transporter (DMT)-like permease
VENPSFHPDRRALTAGILSGIAAGAFWGAIFLGPKLLVNFSPIELSVARYLVYGVLSALLIIPRWKVLATVTAADWWALARLSLIGNLIYYVFISLAVQLSGIAVASLIVGLLPATITLIGSREQNALPFRRLAAPLLLMAIGIVLINLDLFTRDPGHGSALTKLLGVLCAIIALAAWTYYAVANTRWLRRAPQFSNQNWALLTGLMTGAMALLATPVFLFHGGQTSMNGWTQFWLVSGGIALGGSVIGTAFWNAASRLLPLTLSGQMIVFETLFALLYNFIAEQRLPRPLELAAIVALAAGIWWSARRHPGLELPSKANP